MDATEKKAFDEWIEDNGDKSGALYMTFSDEELEKIFLTAYERGEQKTDKEIADEYFKKTYPSYIGCDKFTEDIKDAVIYGLRTGYNKAMKEWRDCFLSCSSPYCADKFKDIRSNGMLGNMTKEITND